MKIRDKILPVPRPLGGEEEISSLINKRLEAKKEKNYAKADEIRNLLKEKGIELIDQSKEITTWIRV